jgi:hypothetical protein
MISGPFSSTHRPKPDRTGASQSPASPRSSSHAKLTNCATSSTLARFLSGAIAQLGERYNGIVEVVGSIPSGSTKYTFRNTSYTPENRMVRRFLAGSGARNPRVSSTQLNTVPLSTQADAILRELHPPTGHGALHFPGQRSPNRPISDNTINAALRTLGYSGDLITGHGFRGMASTLLNEQGWYPDAIERQLAHGERNKVRAARNYARMIPERRKMMQAWADYWDGLRADGVPIVK